MYICTHILITIALNRGDTLSIYCKNLNLSYKLDLRLIADTEGSSIKAATDEFANSKKKIKKNKEKLYDRLKSVLVST